MPVTCHTSPPPAAIQPQGHPQPELSGCAYERTCVVCQVAPFNPILPGPQHTMHHTTTPHNTTQHRPHHTTPHNTTPHHHHHHHCCRDILSLSRLAAGPSEPTGSFTGSQQQPHIDDAQHHSDPAAAAAAASNDHGAATPAFSAGGVSATHGHPPQPGSRLRHSSSAVHAGGRPAGSLLASASLGHWGTTTTPASKAAAAGGHLGDGMSPAVSNGSDVHLQQRQQHVVASTPQCGPPGQAFGGAGAAAAAAAGAGLGTSVTSAGSVSFAKSLGGGVYAPGAGGITPLPLAAVHAPGVRMNSCLRGPSPLGPVGFNRDGATGCARETGGLQALLGPQQRERQQQEEGALSAGVAAFHGGGPGSAARRSGMQLLPGSFKLGAGNTHSPGMLRPAPATTYSWCCHTQQPNPYTIHITPAP
jgi:hypothetical protein